MTHLQAQTLQRAPGRRSSLLDAARGPTRRLQLGWRRASAAGGRRRSSERRCCGRSCRTGRSRCWRRRCGSTKLSDTEKRQHNTMVMVMAWMMAEIGSYICEMKLYTIYKIWTDKKKTGVARDGASVPWQYNTYRTMPHCSTNIDRRGFEYSQTDLIWTNLLCCGRCF